jgi:hypothetical protein
MPVRYTGLMLMVIFGAGASYDSAQAYRPIYPGGGSQNFGLPAQPPNDGGPWRPPLGKDLFRDQNHVFGHIVQRYPKLSHILPYLREPSNGRSVEEILESLQDEANGFPERLREFASVRYYLRDLLFEISDRWRDTTSGVTNYAPLIGDILRLNKTREPICLVTFNYDLLLDRALLSFDYHAQVPHDQFKAHPVLKLFKPHGSVDWARFVYVHPDTNLQPQHLIEEADTIQLTDEFITVSGIQEANAFPRGRTVFPCVAIPFQNKTQDTFECPRSHLAQLEKLLPHVTKVLIIGWQAREAHFIELLKSNLATVKHIMVVSESFNDAKSILDYFIQQIGPKAAGVTGHLKPGGFTDFVVNRQGDEFLRA